MISWFGLSLALGFVWYSFVLWRSLREDYPEEDVLLTTVLLALTAYICSGLGRFFGGSFLGVLIVLILWCYKKKWNFWEWADEAVTQSLPLGVIGALALRSWVMAGILATSYSICLLTKRFYRGWSWYKSGKQGLVGTLAILGWSLPVAMILPGGVYWAGWFLTISIIVIYLRSGHKIWQR